MIPYHISQLTWPFDKLVSGTLYLRFLQLFFLLSAPCPCSAMGNKAPSLDPALDARLAAIISVGGGDFDVADTLADATQASTFYEVPTQPAFGTTGG